MRPSPLAAQLPAGYWNVPYVGARHPGSPAVAERPGLAEGANCQLYAYAVLARFGPAPPPLRSDELWADREHTVRVRTPRLLDLLLFNAGADAYGAHVGVWLGEDAVLHLCREVGLPAVWPLADFAARERYAVLVGIKRMRPAGARG
ncbi:hydrolase [Kitasatospora sp. NPDC004240]